MRLEAVKGRQRALYSFGGGLPSSWGIGALGAVLGIVVLLLIQGCGDAREFGKRPGVFCTSAGGELVTGTTGHRFCAFWVDPYVPATDRSISA